MYNKPLAYFITFTAYGTWLHGDSRKSIVVENHSTKLIEPQESFLRHEQQKLKHPVVMFDEKMRRAILEAIMERCLWKQWHLYAAHVRSNHVHVIVNSTDPIDKVMASLKAWATRKLRQSGYDFPKVWTRHGSTKYIFTREKMLEKIHYVVHEQGEMMAYYIDPEFE
ncbi:MAG: transposase, partial [Methylococcales bacterium]|nr:transposase [Methylococcales bacterium]